MKKLFAVALLTVAVSANAFWSSNNNNYNGYGGYQNDNGMFGYNPYDFWDPRWYFEEMSNMVDEFDDNGWNNNGGGYGYRPYNRNGYDFVPNRPYYPNYQNNPYMMPNTIPVMPVATPVLP